MRSSRQLDGEVHAWCAAHGHTGAAELLMVHKCEELGALDDAVPVQLEVLASMQCVLRVEVVEMSQAGCIYVDGSHFRIRLRASDSTQRQRFTLAHEICHTFFESTRLHGVTDNEVGRYAKKDLVEHLCDLGAAELLLPRETFCARCPQDPDFDDVAAVASEFDASLEATASRIVGLGLGPRQLVVLEPKLTLEQERSLARARTQSSFAGFETCNPPTKLRVRWATGGDRFVPPNKSVNEGSVLARCIDEGDVEAVEDPGITRGEAVRVVARHLPYTRNGFWVDRVLAFLYEP